MGLLEFVRCGLVTLCLLALFELAVVAVVVWGLVATIRLVVARARGLPFPFRPRRFFVAVAIVVVPLCLFKLVTWYPELSGWFLRGRTPAEVVYWAGSPNWDGRRDPGYSPPADLRFDYWHRGCSCYSVRFHDDQVVEVVVSEDDK
jgi:hypothetical protein